MLFKILLLGLVIGSQGVAEVKAAENAGERQFGKFLFDSVLCLSNCVLNHGETKYRRVRCWCQLVRYLNLI